MTFFNGAFRERLRNSWVEMRENLTRSSLQSLGVILGVASVLGGFSISDSMRRRSMELYVKMGGLDKLNVRQSAVVNEGAPTALQMANLGLRNADAVEGEELDSASVDGISLRKDARARVRSPYADQEREIRGVGGDFLALDGYEIDQGRDFTMHDIDTAAPVAILGTEAVSVFFPPVRSRASWIARRSTTSTASRTRSLRGRSSSCAGTTRAMARSRSCGERISGTMTFSLSAQARRISLRSSRTFPGQS